MSFRTTLVLLLFTIGLGAFIFLFERHQQPAGRDQQPGHVFSDLNFSSVNSIIVRPAQRVEIKAIHTNNTWRILKPISYPASSTSVQILLDAFQQLVWHSCIKARELKDRPNYIHEFGFDSPQFSLVIEHDGIQMQLLIGSLSPLRDEVFLQIVGRDEIFLVPSELLQFLPRTSSDWRDPILADLKNLAFDRLTVTNGAKTYELVRDKLGKPWHLVRPIEARTDNPRVNRLLEDLQSLRISQFVTDEPKTDLENFGLQPPELELTFAQGEEPVLSLQFGKSPTTNNTLIYARRADTTSIVLVTNTQLAPWRGSFDEFRDRHIVTLTTDSVDEVEVHAVGQFILQRQTNNLWRIVSPVDLPADPALVREMIGTLGGMQIVQFVKSVVTEPDLPSYGLSPAARQYTLRTHGRGGVSNPSNSLIAQLEFGAITNGSIFVRRSDESTVYAVNLADFQNLPTGGWQLRDRRIWSFTENEVTRLVVHQNGKMTELLHNGTNQWAFAATSQGIINNFAIEEVTSTLGELSAAYWTAHGVTNLLSFGFTENSQRISVDVKRGDRIETLTLELGGITPTQLQYGATTLDGETWVFELPTRISELIRAYLSIPGEP